MPRILFAEDDGGYRAAVVRALRDVAGYEVTECSTADEALDRLRRESFDVVLTDLRMPGTSGLELMKQAAARMPDCVLIVLTAYASIDTTIEAMRVGVHDFLVKPVRVEALLCKIELLLKHQAALAENRFWRSRVGSEVPVTGIVGVSDAIRQVHKLIARVAPSEATVLITGETGAGKELVARAIHHGSPRRDLPFVTINCGSIPETLLEGELFGHVRGAFTGADRDKKGLFEVADSGTIFLDEIGELPLSLQPKLLRALEGREILRVGSTSPIRLDARILAATHRHLSRMVEAGQFRADLYFRLNVFQLPLPPLRGRPEDIGPLALHLLERLCARAHRPLAALTPDALIALEGYAWPGNVRELANVLERALILTDSPRVSPTELPAEITGDSTANEENLRSARENFERLHVRRGIRNHGGDKRRAAEALGIDLATLYRKLEA
jgi:DNA-binding NtrC family response regulator